MPVYLLIDNGSKQPEASLRLRQLAADLGRHTGKAIHPVSLQHVDAIPSAQLGGTPAPAVTSMGSASRCSATTRNSATP